MLQVNTIPVLQTIANLAIASNGAFGGIYAGLFTGNPVITRGMNLTALTEAAFQGYARQGPINWGATLTLASGGASFVGQRCQFVANIAMNLPQVINGAFLANGSVNGSLLACGAFNNPISVVNPGDSVNFNPGLEFGFDTNYGDLPGPNP
jgi:hypothetical protein